MLRSKLSFSNIVVLLALFLALGGTGYAALAVPKNSIGKAQIKANSIDSSKVKNGSLLSADFKKGQLPRGATGAAGPAGPAGAAGAAGAPGSALGYAHILANGTVDLTRSKNVPAGSVVHPATGFYCFASLPFSPSSASVAIDHQTSLNGHLEATYLSIGATDATASCNPQSAVAAVVVTEILTVTPTTTGTLNRGFYIVFN